VVAAAISPSGEKLATGGSKDGTVIIWDVQTGSAVHTVERTMGSGKHRVVDAAWSPGETELASCTSWHTEYGGWFARDVVVWDSATGDARLTLRLGFDASSLAWSPDGTRLAVGGSHRVTLFDAGTGEPWLSLHGRSADSVAWSPGGAEVAFADGKRILVWNTETGEVGTWEAKGHRADSVVWSPDGAQLASGCTSCFSGSGGVVVWDVEKGEARLSLEEEGASSVAWSPDGMQLACEVGGEVTVWDLKMGARLKLGGHPGEVVSVRWGNDGRTIVSVDREGTVLTWDAAGAR
jgi:WD40 repeat protein